MKNLWKFQSAQKLGSKPGSNQNSPSPMSLSTKLDSFPSPQKQEFESNALMYKSLQNKQQSQFLPQNQKQFRKYSQHSKVQQAQKKPRQREQSRKNKGLSTKLKAKLQQQLKTAYKQLQEKDASLNSINTQIDNLNLVLRQKKRVNDDLNNNKQMLLFKQKQLNNLTTIHGQLLETAKKDIMNQKNTKISYEQKILTLKKKIAQLSYKCNEKREFRELIQQIKQQKIQMQSLLAQRKMRAEKKSQIKNEAIRELLQDLVKRKKRQLQEQCEYKVKMIREVSNVLKKPEDLKVAIQRRNIMPSDYYTFGQLKFVPQLNFRVNKESQRIMEIFYKEINPKIPEIIERFQEPAEYLKLKEELNNLNRARQKLEEEFKRKQKQLQGLEMEKEKLKKSVSQLKDKITTTK